jgi:hypothetical protein
MKEARMTDITEGRLRAAYRRCGLRIRKSRVRNNDMNSRGKYQLIDVWTNTLVDWDADLERLAYWLPKWQAERPNGWAW